MDRFMLKIVSMDVVKAMGGEVKGLDKNTPEGVQALIGEVAPRLPNGVKIFNSTPHDIRFWDESWPESVEVPSHLVINAQPTEVYVGDRDGVELVKTEFWPTAQGNMIVQTVPDDVLIIGSIIAAQAYPGKVLAMTPCDGYERVAPADKRMRPDKFTVF